MPGKNGKRPMRPEDLYLLRSVFDPQLSPDGKRVAYTSSQPDKDSDSMHTSIWVAPVDGRGRARRFTQGTRDHSPRWSPDGRYLAFVSRRNGEGQIFVAPLDGGEARQLTNAKFGAGQPTWSPDGKRIAYAARTGDFKPAKDRNTIEKNAPRVIRDLRYKLDGVGFFDERRPHIFTIDVDGGDERQITSGDYEDGQPAWSPDGKWLAFVSDRDRERFQRQWRGDLWVVPSTGGRPRRLTRGRGLAAYPQFSPDGRWIAYLGHEHNLPGSSSSKNKHVFIVPAQGGQPPRSVSAPLDRSPHGVLQATGRTFCWSRDGKSLLFLVEDGGSIILCRAGAANGSVSQLIDGDRQITGFDLTPDGRTAVFASSWLSEPAEVYAAPLSGGTRPRNLSHANADARATLGLARPRRITYAGADGWPIEALVLHPPAYQSGKRYPLSLQIHGGPHAFHPAPAAGAIVQYQMQAAAGYVVLLPNPRGSAGYGESFSEACVKDWGGKDYEDLMAGVDELVRRGVADPGRLVVGGASYGGFMTTWTVGHTDRFRAAVVGAPVSDLISKFGECDIGPWYTYEVGGTPFDNLDEYVFRSPVTYLSNVKTPVLLQHWEGDMRCPVGQSEEIFAGLKALGKEVEFVRYPGGFHTVRTPSQEVDRFQRILVWCDSHGASAKRARRKALARA
jgi:dipeptidyl aminopeptidase/acylaminoacyl peptidase